MTGEPTGPGYDKPIPLGDSVVAMFGPFLISCAACGAAMLIKGGREITDEPAVMLHAEWHQELATGGSP